MRCPKCGYTSFDHLDSCKKCGKDLMEFKERFGIRSVLFPGQMTPVSSAEEESYDAETADAAVAAATTGAAAAVAAGPVVVDDSVESGASDSDDFGFDFMGDSAEDDDLSFDELFEEAPEDEDVEETIEAPKAPEQVIAEENAEDEEEFSFDLSEDDEGLEDDFGFDPDGDDTADDDFSFADDAGQGPEEDPKSPFDLPESSDVEEAPDSKATFSMFDASLTPAADERLSGVDKPIPPEEVEVVRSVTEPLGLTVSEKESETVFDPSGGEALSPPSSLGMDEAGTVEMPAATLTEPGAVLFSDQRPAVENGDDGDRVLAAETAVGAGSANFSVPALGSRVGAFACDLILLCLVGVSFVVVAEAAMSTEGNRYWPTLETLVDLSIPYFLVLFSLAFGYFTLFHFLAGQTPGKMLAGVRVETFEGEPLTFAHAFLRSVGGLLQLLPLGLGYLAALFSHEQRGWNDQLAGTRIVNLKESA